MQLRHLPRSKSGSKHHACNPGRPVPMNDIPMRQEVDQRFFPDSVDRIAPCIADNSIPTLDSILQRTGNSCAKQLSRLVEEQMVHEKLTWAQTECSEDSLSHCSEEVSPPVCSEFQASRLLLSHFGFLTPGGPEEGEANSPLIVLDTKKVSFANDLKTLDKMSPRTNDTVHVFYVRAGQNSERDIIANMAEENLQLLDQHFWALLKSLGWTANVNEHAGWTGNLTNSWCANSAPASNQEDLGENFKFNGEKQVLYWADVGAEIAFVVPTAANREDNDTFDEPDKPFERSVSEVGQGQKSAKPPRTLSLDLEKANISSKMPEPVAPARRRATSNKPTIGAAMSTKLLLVWLESFEDHISLPTEQLLPYTRTGDEAQTGVVARAADCHIIFLHSLNSGLLRVKLQAPQGRMNFATPLVDGMVASRRVVGNLVRQTVYNMARRRRLENEAYQPPHVRRRMKVQEMVQKYKLDLTHPELLAHLFKNSN